jgi:hydroxyacylglutathione hydrolase
MDREVREGDVLDLGGHEIGVLDMGGHTAGHIAYWLPDDGVAFVGDTLFALGCGRLFEGTPQQMWTSLGKLMALPPETVVWFIFARPAALQYPVQSHSMGGFCLRTRLGVAIG